MSAPNAIQDLGKAQLLKNPFFSDSLADVPNPVPIVTADDGDIENELEKRLSVLKGGLAITLLIPVGSNEENKVHGIVCPKLMVEISAVEFVTFNRSSSGMNKKAYDAIRKIMASYKADGTGGLNFWNPGPPFSRLEFSHFEEMGVKTAKSNKTLLIYRALFETTEMIG